MKTTVGQILVNEALPPKLRDYTRVLDKAGVQKLLASVAAERDPQLYSRVVQRLHEIGAKAVDSSAHTLHLEDFDMPPRTKRLVDQMKLAVNAIVEREDLDPEDKNQQVIDLVGAATPVIEDTLMKEAEELDNPIAEQILSGARATKGDLRSLIVGDLLVTDHRGRVIPVPAMHGYAQGLSAPEYWAAAYGARKGSISAKLSTGKTGFIAKQLVQSAHNQVVTSDDCGTDRGIPVDYDDSDNVGTLLVQPIGDIPSGTLIDAKVHERIKDELKDADDKDRTVFVRSPLTCEAPNGVCARCAGIRERGSFPEVGDNIGLTAAQAMGERLTQTALGAKHLGGRASARELAKQEARPHGYELVNQLIQSPETFKGGAVLTKADGIVKSISPAPQGGSIVKIGEEPYWVPEYLDVKVKPGDRVEDGDALSDGIVDPAEIVARKGLGAGRLSLLRSLRDAYKESGLTANRRNIELVTRGLVNHVRVTDLDGVSNALPDDVLEYSSIERNYRPRYGFRTVRPASAVGNFLEKPIRQYTIGTRVTPRVADELDRYGVKEVTVHNDPPPFQPEMVRAMEHLTKAPDWQQRLGGSYLEKGLLQALHRGVPSQLHSESYLPSLARGENFGAELKTKGEY